MNNKAKGEKGQQILIGELAKYEVAIALPLSDNLPWDLILIENNGLGEAKKIQIKTSEDKGSTEGAIRFDFRRTNWHQKTQKRYSPEEIDAIFGYDMIDDKHYIFLPTDFNNKSTITLRKMDAKNGQTKGIQKTETFLLNTDRLNLLFS